MHEALGLSVQLMLRSHGDMQLCAPHRSSIAAPHAMHPAPHSLLQRALRVLHVLARVRQLLQRGDHAALVLPQTRWVASALVWKGAPGLHSIIDSSRPPCSMEQWCRMLQLRGSHPVAAPSSLTRMTLRSSSTRILGDTEMEKGPPRCWPSGPTSEPYSSSECWRGRMEWSV